MDLPAAFLFMKKTFLSLCILLLQFLCAQDYPRWFLFPKEIGCSKIVTVIAPPPTFYRDSAIAFGFRMGCDLLARYSMMRIIGGQAFWTTEAGDHSMGARYEQRYDTLLTEFYKTNMKVLDSYIDKQKTLVWVGDSACVRDESVRSLTTISAIRQPVWIEQIPEDNQYQYGVGFSQEFFYETSSWQTAEKNACMALARSVQVTLQSMQKRDAREAQNIQNEELDVTLANIEIQERWKDEKKKIYYVLARTKK